MTKLLTTLALFSSLGLLHCASATAPSATDALPVAYDDGIEPSGLVPPSDRCVAEIERPIPADPVLKLGTSIVLKTGGAVCPPGLDEKLAYRYYVEKVDRNGNIISPRKSPMGPTEWSFTKLAFDTSVLDGPGRYRIYGFSLPRTMVAAWQVGDQAAKERSRRTGNAYVELVTTSWASGAPLACSVTCGGGTQVIPAACKDNGGVTRPDSWCSGDKPADGSQACNADACPLPTNTLVLGGTETFSALENISRVTWYQDPTDTSMECQEYWECRMLNGYSVEARWWPNHQALVYIAVSFETKPTAEGDYTVTSVGMPTGTNASVQVYDNRPAYGTPSLAPLNYSATTGIVKVRRGADDKLHVLYDNLAAGPFGTVKATVAVDP